MYICTLLRNTFILHHDIYFYYSIYAKFCRASGGNINIHRAEADLIYLWLPPIYECLVSAWIILHNATFQLVKSMVIMINR